MSRIQKGRTIRKEKNMIDLVTGGAASGKSEYAESLLKESPSKVYLATMYNDGSEGARYRIERHRKLREGKGFRTIECPFSVDEIQALKRDDEVLLEDLSNLLTNEMYLRHRTVKETFDSLLRLDAHVKRLVIVTSQIFSDGKRYDSFTEEFIRNLSYLNKNIAADRTCCSVTEVVCGIPVRIK